MSLLVWLPLNGSLENKGISPATFSLVTTGGGVDTSTGGKIATNCYRRSTRNTVSHITSDINFSLTGDVSMACWCKLTDYGTTDSANGIITQHGHLTGGLGITMKYISANDYRMSINTGSKGDSFPSAERDRTFHTYYGNTNIYNKWHHLCLTYTVATKQICMYVDGKLDRSPITVAGNNTTARPFRIFDWSTDHSGNASYRPPCYLNDVRLYDHCLSPREVKLLAQGLVAHYKLETYTPNLLTNADKYTYNSPLTRTSASKDGWETSDMYCQVTPGETYYFSCETDGQWYQHNTAGVSPTNKYATVWFYLTKTYDPNNTGYDNPICLTKDMGGGRWIYTIPSGYNGLRIRTNTYSDGTNAVTIKFWNFHLSKGTCIVPYKEKEYDCSGYNNHGTYSTTFNPNFNAPRYKNCALFENKKYIAATRSSDSTSITLSTWVKLDSYPGSNTVVMVDQNSKVAFGFWGTQNAIMSCGTDANTTRTITNLKGKWDLNKWHHIAVVKSSSTYTFYLDGIEWTALGGAYGGNNYWTHTPANELLLGGRHNGSSFDYPFTGKISDARIYATALPAAAVKELYQSSISFLDNGTLQCSEIVENNTNLKYNQNGIVQANELNEIGYIDQMKIKIVDNKAWARIYWFNTQTTKTYFQSEAEVLECTNASNRFSLMKYVDYFKDKNGNYEFMLTYPLLSSTGYNSWRQTNSPNVNYGSHSGYVALHTDFSYSSYVGPLTYSNSRSSSMYSANQSGNWWSPVGQRALYGEGIPASNGATTHETELWVRIDNLPKLKKLSMFNKALQAHQIYEL